MENREFTVAHAHQYDRVSTGRWLWSHLRRYPFLPLVALAGTGLNNALLVVPPLLTGRAFDLVLGGTPTTEPLLWLALAVLAVGLGRALLQIIGAWSLETLAQRLERDAREELAISLLGKSQTFHSRQQVGDIMARATSDVRQLQLMVNPGVGLILPSVVTLAVAVMAIAWRFPVLLPAPVLFVIGFVVLLRRYMGELAPVSANLRVANGELNAELAEAVSGVEVVKAYAQEPAERARFDRRARAYRNLFVEQGMIQGRYLPLLLLAVIAALAFGQALWRFSAGAMSVGDVVAYMGLVALLRFPTFISVFSFSVLQMGLAGAARILDLLNAETELDQNTGGVARPIIGEIEFEEVSFGYGGEPVLDRLSFRAAPGETIAIVGQTGSGKSTLTQLVNRTYDTTAGRVLIDGVDVRDWSLDSLRSQISAIEQDVFLFSRSVADNIAFGAPGQASRDQIEQAAREAQAHDFIMALSDGYDTVIGERGVTLSGGQRQRLAIARAFLTNPRILILDDSTSAIDSATEDEIQRAMRRIMQGRTTLLITHRLSQIRWADRILLLRRGRIVDQGRHEELLARSALYRGIFARYESVLATGVVLGEPAAGA
ncbi:MAG: ABC transporter ATP-binding protein [Chloroflexi bacterium]|nr:ABC transporter ATP-binding protein [Chloroflexota bacterium]